MKAKEPIKIEAIVKSKDERFFFVFNREIEFIYTQFDRETIIGEDEKIYNFFFYESPSKNWKAFGGREFDLKMSDGSTIHCFGQWWDGLSKTARLMFDDVLSNIAYSDVESLKKCYVYCSGRCDINWINKLLSEYNGKIYEYYEFEKIIKNRYE